MTRLIKKQLLPFLLCTVIFVSACSPTVTSENEEFNQYIDSVAEELLEDDSLSRHFVLPASATENTSTLTLPPQTLKHLKKTFSRQKSYLENLKHFEDHTLSDSQRYTKQVLIDNLTRQLALEPYVYYTNPFGPSSVVSNISRNMALYSFSKEQDLKDYSELLLQIPNSFDEAVAFEKERRKQNIYLADFQLDDLIQLCNTMSEATDDENIYITEFDKKVDELTELTKEQKKTYKENNKHIVHETIQPAYKNLKLALEKIPGTSEPKTKVAYYEALMLQRVGTDLSPDEAIPALEKEVASIIDSSQTALKENPDLSLEYTTALQKLSEPKEIIEELSMDTKINYPEIAEVSYTLKEMPAALASTNTAFYVVPPYDTSVQNTVYINSAQIGSEGLFSTLAHETYPGHLYQTNYTLANNLPLLRYLMTCEGYEEGWGIYAQLDAYQYLEFQGTEKATQKSLQTMCRQRDILNIYLLSLSDLYVNAKHYDANQLAAYLKPYGIEQTQAKNVYQYVISNPCTYLTYGLGYYEFSQLELQTKEKLGDQFDIKQFHKQLLDAGSCSFPILKTRLTV